MRSRRLMAVSLAALRVLEAEAGVDLRRDAAFVAGHSLGEYSALAAAGALTIADAARLLRIRGRAMQKAVPVGVGAMAALIGVELARRPSDRGRSRRRRSLRCRQRQWRRPGRLVGRQGRGRARGGNRQGARRQAGDDAAGVGAFPLSADAAGGRCDGGGAWPGSGQGAASFRWSPMCWPGRSAIRREIVRSLVEQVTGTVRWRESVLFMAQAGVTDVLRSRRRQGADRLDQAHRGDGDGVRRSARPRTSHGSTPAR